MTYREIKKAAKGFKRKFGIGYVDYETLVSAIEKQGYTVVEFNSVFNDENVKTLVETLNLTEKVSRSKGFSYADRSYRLVFVNEDLSANEKTIVLAHELGHICLGHLYAMPIIGLDVQEEFEANEFAHLLMKYSRGSYGAYHRKKRRILAGAAAAAVLAAGVGITFAVSSDQEAEFSREYYITPTGTKYHEEECIFVKNNDNRRQMTAEEFADGTYEPCKTCLPE